MKLDGDGDDVDGYELVKCDFLKAILDFQAATTLNFHFDPFLISDRHEHGDDDECLPF